MTPVLPRPALEVADVIRAHGAAYQAQHAVSAAQATVLRRLAACRTAALGGHVERCQQCDYARIAYNSCRDRHCPKCQGVQRAAWLQARLERLLPVPYFHVVFTLPAALHPLVLHNARRLYDLLFQAAAQTLLTLAADPKRLGAQIGVTALLHTWGQNLLFHPHLHCVVTGGGLAPDSSHWVATRPGYFLPVKVLGRLFRGKFLAGVRRAYDDGQLTLPAGTDVPRLLDRLYRQDWVIYAKPPFGGAEQVFRYLGRYSHRVAISNSRLLTLADGRVSFRWKDYAAGQQTKVMELTAEEFLRRFLLHVLPPRFVRIRHYGLLASRHVHTQLARCRELLGAAPVAAPAKQSWQDWVRAWTGTDPAVCPRCQGPLQRQALSPWPAGAVPLVPVIGADSS